MNRKKYLFGQLLALLAVWHILGNICTTILFLYTSHHKYPGGLALYRLHQIEASKTGIYQLFTLHAILRHNPIKSYGHKREAVGWMYCGLTPLYQLKSYHGSRYPHMFPGFLTPVLTQLFFPKPRLPLTCFCIGEMQKYTGKKVCLNEESNPQPAGHKSDMIITEQTGQGDKREIVKENNLF